MGSVDLYNAVMKSIMIVFFVIWFVNMINTAADTVTDLKISKKNLQKTLVFLDLMGQRNRSVFEL